MTSLSAEQQQSGLLAEWESEPARFVEFASLISVGLYKPVEQSHAEAPALLGGL